MNMQTHDPNKFSHGGKVHNSATKAKFSHRGTIQPHRQSLDNSAMEAPTMHTT